MTAPPGLGGTRWAACPVDQRGDIYHAEGARFYDRLTESDTSEIRELLSLLPGRPAHVLDLAAGSGRLTVPMLATGRRVTALDSSADMLGLLEARVTLDPRLSRRGEALTMVQADMTRFDTGVRYDAVVLGTTSISLLDRTARAACLARVAAHLLPEGPLLVSTLDVDLSAAASPESVTPVALDGIDYELIEAVDVVARRRHMTVARLQPDAPAVWTTFTHLVGSAELVEQAAEVGLVLTGQHTVGAPSAGSGRRIVLNEFRIGGGQ